MLYSKGTGGFYSRDIHADIPADAVEISDDEYAALIEGQAAGKVISADAQGRPTLSDPAPPSLDVLAKAARADRDARLSACDWTQLADAPLTAAEKTAWKTYRQALRDVPAQAGFPSSISWPVSPA